MVGGYGVYGESLSKSLIAEVMTIRVKKSDIDSFNSEELDFEQFREKVQILVY
jgi:hypothetical protein